jgi:hypothetical protein
MSGTTNITYAGGPIVTCPLVYLNFWGDLWSDSTHAPVAASLLQFHQDLLASNFMNILTQYGITGRDTAAVTQSSFAIGVANTPTAADYENIFNIYMAFGLLPQPATSGTPLQVVITYLDENTAISDPSHSLSAATNTVSGYHDHYVAPDGAQFYYAFLSYPLGLDQTSTVNLLSQVGSHEFAEMVTDPQYNAWTPDSGVTEIADPCENETGTITVGANTWTVQQLWSQTIQSCIGPVANPIPAIPGGPVTGLGSGRAPGMASGTHPALPRPRTKPASHERILPLPPVYLDVQSKSLSMKPEHVRRYAKKLFHPLRHDQVFGNLPQRLRLFADLIEQETDTARQPGSAR